MTREEAIEKVREMKLSPGKDAELIIALHTLIPELRDSEDERMKKAIVHILYENYSDAAVVEGVEIAEIVAWLEKQKEQKPEDRFKEAREKYQVEWSEDDEKMIKSILFVLESYVSQSESASSPSLITSYPTYYKEIDWLKSLRSRPKSSDNWKPSEEQMEALKDAVRLFKATHFEKVHYKIESLYEQLKKLM